MSATKEDSKSLTSNLNSFSDVTLADISSLSLATLSVVLGRVLAESSPYATPAPAPSFGSAI